MTLSSNIINEKYELFPIRDEKTYLMSCDLLEKLDAIVLEEAEDVDRKKKLDFDKKMPSINCNEIRFLYVLFYYLISSAGQYRVVHRFTLVVQVNNFKI